MGCCASTESSPTIAASQPPSQAALHRPSTHASSHSNRQNHQDLTSHINKRLRLHVWSSSGKIWTNISLDRERLEFFDTRVTGRSEIWQTIKAALEVLWTGGDPDDTDGGLGTAQLILNAAGITIPTGDLASGVYDSFGAFYPLPEHIVSNPTNLAIITPSTTEQIGNHSAGETNQEPNQDDIIRRREEKGKSVVKPKDQIELRVKLSDREAQAIKVTVSKDDSVRLVARKVMEEGNLPATKQVRIAYMGRILKENQPLITQGWHDNHVLNGLVFNL